MAQNQFGLANQQFGLSNFDRQEWVKTFLH